MNQEKPKILFFDIEVTPLISYTWGIWEQDVVEVKEEWHMLSFGYKWLGEKHTHVVSLPDFKSYQKNKKDDKELVKTLWKLFDMADIVIAHNGDEYDIKKTRARFVQHNLPPPTPFKSIDTKKVAKRYFKFDSNKLDHLGQYLNLGRKVKHEGFSLWLGCMAGDMKAWQKMCEYNKQDVILLEKVYLSMLPYMTNHPDRSILENKYGACPNCGFFALERRGKGRRKGAKGVIEYSKMTCKNCGSWHMGDKILPYAKVRKKVVNY